MHWFVEDRNRNHQDATKFLKMKNFGLSTEVVKFCQSFWTGEKYNFPDMGVEVPLKLEEFRKMNLDKVGVKAAEQEAKNAEVSLVQKSKLNFNSKCNFGTNMTFCGENILKNHTYSFMKPHLVSFKPLLIGGFVGSKIQSSREEFKVPFESLLEQFLSMMVVMEADRSFKKTNLVNNTQGVKSSGCIGTASSKENLLASQRITPVCVNNPSELRTPECSNLDGISNKMNIQKSMMNVRALDESLSKISPIAKRPTYAAVTKSEKQLKPTYASVTKVNVPSVDKNRFVSSINFPSHTVDSCHKESSIMDHSGKMTRKKEICKQKVPWKETTKPETSKGKRLLDYEKNNFYEEDTQKFIETVGILNKSKDSSNDLLDVGSSNSFTECESISFKSDVQNVENFSKLSLSDSSADTRIVKNKMSHKACDIENDKNSKTLSIITKIRNVNDVNDSVKTNKPSSQDCTFLNTGFDDQIQCNPVDDIFEVPTVKDVTTSNSEFPVSIYENATLAYILGGNEDMDSDSDSFSSDSDCDWYEDDSFEEDFFCLSEISLGLVQSELGSFLNNCVDSSAAVSDNEDGLIAFALDNALCIKQECKTLEEQYIKGKEIERLKQVNQQWKEAMAKVPEKQVHEIKCKKVHFAPEKQLTRVHELADVAEFRKGPWEELARDRCRFQKVIQDFDNIISPVLLPCHRKKMYDRIYKNQEN